MDAHLTHRLDQAMAEVDSHINYLMGCFTQLSDMKPEHALAMVAEYLTEYPNMTLEGLASMTARCIQRMANENSN